MQVAGSSPGWNISPDSVLLFLCFAVSGHSHDVWFKKKYIPHFPSFLYIAVYEESGSISQ